MALGEREVDWFEIKGRILKVDAGLSSLCKRVTDLQVEKGIAGIPKTGVKVLLWRYRIPQLFH